MAVACEAVREAISAYRFGGVNPEASAETAEHLGQCAECRASLEEVVGAADERLVAAAFTQVQVSDGFAAGVLQRLTETESTAPGVDGSAASGTSLEEEEDPEIAALLATGRHGGGAPGGRSGMGMVIQHCALCRERIDTADLKSGSAIQFKGQAYCSGCKAEVENDPEYLEELEAREAKTRRKSGRREAVGSGIHAGMGRRVRGEPAAARSGGNPAVLYGGVAAAVLLVGVVGFFLLNQDDGGGGGRDVARVPAKNKPGKNKNRDKTNPGTGTSSKPSGKQPVDEPKTNQPTPAELMAIERALTELRDKYDQIEEFARKNQEPESWASVDGQYAELLGSGAWDRKLVKDNAEVLALREKVEQARAVAKDRFVVAGKDACTTAVNRASGYASRGRFPEALKILDGVPPIFRDSEHYKAVAELRQKIVGELEAAAGEIGKWVEVDHDKWSLPQDQAAQKTKDAEGNTVLTGAPKGALVIFTPSMSQLWRNYVIEGEFFATQGADERALVQLGMRIVSRNGRPAGKAFTFRPEYCNKWIKVRVEVKDSKLTASVDGQQVVEADMGEFQVGKPLLLLNTGASLKIKSARFQLNSIHKPR